MLFGCWFRGNFVFSYEGDSLKHIKMRSRRDGKGDIILELIRTKKGKGRYETDEIGFYNIPEVTRVKQLIDVLVPGRKSV